MLDRDAIRRRLAVLPSALANDIEFTRDEEYYGDWATLGPLRIIAPNDYDLALLDAIRHAADDIRALLAELDARP